MHISASTVDIDGNYAVVTKKTTRQIIKIYTAIATLNLTLIYKENNINIAT